MSLHWNFKSVVKAGLIVSAFMIIGACNRKPVTVAILGDSYSTFAGYIPENYITWYTDEPRGTNDVCSADSTWWKRLSSETGCDILINSSFSGSTICHSGYNGEDYSDRSYVTRLKNITSLSPAPEVLFIFGGTNDHWAKSPLGQLKYSDWTDEEMYETLPAFCWILHYLQGTMPDTEVVVIMNYDLNADLVEGMREASRHYNVTFLELPEIDLADGHPTNKGMAQICDHVKKFLIK